MPRLRALAAAVGLLLIAGLCTRPGTQHLKVLFLGDNGHHKPADRYRQLEPVFAGGIDLVYQAADALADKTLAAYDALIVYANTTDHARPGEGPARLRRGRVPLHCASYCFL